MTSHLKQFLSIYLISAFIDDREASYISFSINLFNCFNDVKKGVTGANTYRLYAQLNIPIYMIIIYLK